MRWQAKLIPVASLVVLAGALPARDATAADELHVELTYDVQGSPRRCWDEVEFRRSVVRRVGYDPFQAGAALAVAVHVSGTARVVEGRIDWHDAGGANMGERTLVGKDGDCGKLLTEISFAIGLQIELLRPPSQAAVAAAPEPTTAPATSSPASSPSVRAPASSSPPAPPPSAPAPRPAETAPPEAAPSSRRAEPPVRAGVLADSGMDKPPWIWAVGAGPALAWHLAPSLSADGRLFVSARHGNNSFELAAEATYPSTTRQNDRTAFRQGLLGGVLAVCRHRFELAACAVGRASQVRVTGLDVDLARSPDGVAVQAGGRLAATAPLGGVWSATASLELLGLLTPYRILLNQTAVWEMPRLAALAGLTLAARFR